MPPERPRPYDLHDACDEVGSFRLSQEVSRKAVHDEAGAPDRYNGTGVGPSWGQ
jgi:hypothetical protein